MKKFFIVLFCITLANVVVAQSVNWNIDNDVTVSESVEYNEITIGKNCTLTINSGAVVTATSKITNNGTINIKDGGQLVTPNVINVNVQKKLESYSNSEWYTLSSPVKKGIKNSFAGTAGDDYALFYLNEETAYWVSMKEYPTDPMFTGSKEGVGFLCAVKKGQTIVFSGKTYIGNTTINCSYTDEENSLKGFHLIGNPFTHNIYKGYNGDTPCSIGDNDLASGYYKLDGNNSWQVKTYQDAIKPCEGILIKTINAHSVPLEDKTLEATSDWSVSWGKFYNQIQLDVVGDCGEDRAYAYFYEGIGLDKIDHISETAPSLGIRYEDVDYAIAHVDEDSRSLDVIFKNNQSGFFTLSVDTEKANLNYLHLIDNVTGDEIDMLKDNTYKFYSFGNEPDNRFKLVMNPNAATTDDNVFAYVSNGDVVITGLESAATLQVFDVMGRMVSTEIISKAEGVVCRTSKPSVTGVYVLRLINENGIKTQKIVVE